MSKSVNEATNAAEWYKKEYCSKCKLLSVMCEQDKKLLCVLANILLELRGFSEEFFIKRDMLDEALAKLKDVER